MASIRLHFLLSKPPPAAVLPSCFFSSLFPSAFNASLRRHRLARSFSAARRLFCSKSDPPLQSDSRVGEAAPSIVGDLLDYLNESWTQFHATAEAKRQLIAAGFRLLNENDEWDLQPGGRYFFTRNMSCLVAFAVGEDYKVGSGFHVIAAHTDSPCLKLKPRSASSKSGYLMVNVQTYGSGLWHTWFDRDLSVAGRVILKHNSGSFIHKLVKVRKPLLRVPTLAIHLDRTVNTEGFKPNLETQLVPLLSTKVDEAETKSEDKTKASSSKNIHHPLLLQVLSEELACDVSEIMGMELNVCDTQPSCLGGGNNEFIFSGRLDNLASSYCALRSLIDSCQSPIDLADEQAIRMIALFDNEEVGSNSLQGAGAPTMFQAMRRIVDCLSQERMTEDSFERTLRSSFLVSADMAHGLHPNFPDKYEEHHRPQLQKGVVIKHNANQRYATSGLTAFLFTEVANLHDLPVQEFAVRNDMGCGSTIGPILASGVGIRTVDCGIPQLSMHSVREICGKEDVDIAYKLFTAFFRSFSDIDKKLIVDF
ncbi:probable aspartyl aminopeptidase [Zingiber officinale]|uniref:probable aspartyl aminopeptidase n=1 Tax=Zingiber officinale TaxID=94328 RepID=UPI001C4D420E|nr:probable aspartyl aminopeptidase [Zingiber officinale]